MTIVKSLTPPTPTPLKMHVMIIYQLQSSLSPVDPTHDWHPHHKANEACSITTITPSSNPTHHPITVHQRIQTSGNRPFPPTLCWRQWYHLGQNTEQSGSMHIGISSNTTMTQLSVSSVYCQENMNSDASSRVMET